MPSKNTAAAKISIDKIGSALDLYSESIGLSQNQINTVMVYKDENVYKSLSVGSNRVQCGAW